MSNTQPGSIGSLIRPSTFEQAVASKLKDLQRQINENATARTLGSSTVGSGSLTIAGGEIAVTDPGGNTVATLGTDAVAGTGLRLFRSSGSKQFEALGNSTFFGGLTFTAIYDMNSNLVFNDDATKGGIARPFFPLGQMVDYTPPTATTTSTSWVTLQTGLCTKWHPRVMWAALVSSSDASTTGQVQLIDSSGNVIGSPLTVPANAVSTVQFTSAVDWPSGSWTTGDTQFLSVQAQRTAGTGTIGVRTLGLIGWLAF